MFAHHGDDALECLKQRRATAGRLCDADLTLSEVVVQTTTNQRCRPLSPWPQQIYIVTVDQNRTGKTTFCYIFLTRFSSPCSRTRGKYPAIKSHWLRCTETRIFPSCDFFCLGRCAFVWRPSKTTDAVAANAGRAVVGAMSVGVAAAAIALGIFLPGYLQRAGIAVPAHCGGE